MKQIWRLARIVVALALGSFAVSGCGGGSSSMGAGTGGEMSSPQPPPAAIQSFTSASNTVHVGESTQLTAVFSGDTANIEGIGAVQSGVAVTTPALTRATTFTLTVRRGSQQVEARVSIAASYRNQFRLLAPSPVAYTQHVAIALADGGALVMGGNSSESLHVPDTDSSHRFDPVTETFTPGPQLAFSAEADLTTPVVLTGGFLLVGPGINSALHLDAGLRATQAFDASTGMFHRVGDLAIRHDGGGSSTTLDDGGVLVAGGQVPAIAVAERYNPTTQHWSAAASMTIARRGHTATRLADGRVLIAGGLVCCDQTGETFTSAAEIYDPRTNVFQATGPLSTARGFHAATLLADGRVLITGGFHATDESTTASAEIYDPSTGRSTPAGNMQSGRSVHSAILLTDGRVLVLGGLQRTSVTDIYDPETGTWAPGPTPAPAVAATATLLRNGKVLVFGGEDASGFPISTAMIYE
jgi:hypothetical protein